MDFWRIVVSIIIPALVVFWQLGLTIPKTQDLLN